MLAIYLSLSLSLANFMVVFHGFLFGPSVVVASTPFLTLYHQGCYGEFKYSEIAVQINFANNSLSGKNGIVTSISAELQSGNKDAVFRPSNEVSIVDTQDEKDYNDISGILEKELIYTSDQKSHFCDGGNNFAKTSIKTIEGNVEAVSVEESKVKNMEIRFVPIDGDSAKMLSVAETKAMLSDQNIGNYYLALKYNIMNDGLIDRIFGRNLHEIRCKLGFHADLYQTYISHGWVDIRVLSCQ